MGQDDWKEVELSISLPPGESGSDKTPGSYKIVSLEGKSYSRQNGLEYFEIVTFSPLSPLRR